MGHYYVVVKAPAGVIPNDAIEQHEMECQLQPICVIWLDFGYHTA